MKKRIGCLSAMLCCVIFCCSCFGYNPIMYRHLSNVNNYKTFEVTFNGIEREEYGTYFDITFPEDVGLDDFYGYGSTKRDGEFDFYAEIEENNYDVLIENGFLENVKNGEKIEIRISDWIYMDGGFHYIIAVRYNGEEYLNVEDGIKNVKRMMNKNRSLL